MKMRVRVRMSSKWWKKVVRGGDGSRNRLRAIKWCTGRSLAAFSRPEEVGRPKKEGRDRREMEGTADGCKKKRKKGLIRCADIR